MAREKPDPKSARAASGQPGPALQIFKYEQIIYIQKIKKVGELSGPIWTDSGVHIILRTA